MVRSALIQAALYARYSSDNQRRTSTEDQIRNGHVIAAREGVSVEVPHVYADNEISGATPLERRPGSRQLMLDAMAGKWSVLIIEALDRFSRDTVDQERMVRRLEHRGVRIIGYADGYDSKLEGREFFRQVRGSFNEQQLRDIGKKTHRGLDGQVERGYHAGGISYGYRSECVGVDSKGEPIGYRLQVNEAAAAHVRWIFNRYAEGWSCQRLAADLNLRGIPAPRGRTWAVSALYGSPAKGSGILNNALYIGEYIWNRSRWVKEPDTKKRQRFARPREEWKISKRPELAIVTPEAWRAVRERMDRPRLAGGARGRGQRPRTLFGGLLQCGQCGGAIVAVSQRLYGCAARKDRGASVCAGVHVPRGQLEARLLSTFRDELLSPEAVALVQTEVARILTSARRDREQTEARTRARQAELGREIGNLVDAVASFGPSDAIKAKLRAAEAERDGLRHADSRAPSPEALAGLPAAYKRMVADLQGSLAGDIPRAREILREAFGTLNVVKEGKAVYVEVETRPERLLMAAGGSSLEVVAGTRFGTRKRVRVR